MRNHLNKTPPGKINPNAISNTPTDRVREGVYTIVTQRIPREHIHREKYSGTHPIIESDFQLGIKYYELSTIPSEMSSQKIEKEDALHLAMLYCQHALDHVGTNKDRLIKTDILLLMVAIARSMGKNSWTQERHFYHAVEIARSCLRKDFLMTDHGKKIKKCFDEYIDPNWSKMFKNSWDNQVLAQLQLHIANESNARQAYRMKQAEDTKNYISAIDTSDKILDKLQSALSDPFRLIIIEAESGIISMCHNIERTEAEALEENSHGIRTIHADVFHKPKTYQYIIDRGSREGTSQFSEDQIKGIIEPILKIYIKRLEFVFFSDHGDHGLCIRQNEAIEDIDKPPQDYSEFIGRVLSDIRYTKNIDDMNTPGEYIQAITIARMIIVYSRNKTPPTTYNLFGQIHSILGGNINRNVFDMVSSILLSRNETMHGTGYPFGHNQGKISLIGRLYGIIRAHEALQTINPNNPEKAVSDLENWGGGGYFDRGLLSIFVATLSGANKIVTGQKKNLTEDDKNSYEPYLKRWKEIITLMDDIEGLYDKYRAIGASENTQKKYTALIDEKRLDILRAAELMNLIRIERHAHTNSDIELLGIPGSKYEGLAPIGIANAKVSGDKLRQVDVRIYSSPLPRATGTAEIVCQRVYYCMGSCVRCPHVERLECLTNPPKHLEDGQSSDQLARFVALGPIQKDLQNFTHDIVSSSRQSAHLILTHGDIMRHLLTMFRYKFNKNYFKGQRDDVSHDKTYEILFRGVQIIPLEHLLFTISDWSVMIDTINTFTKSIFGDIFYDRGNKQINLKKIKNKFLDYIDLKNKTDPEKVQIFIQSLDNNNLTAHFSRILKIEGVIK